MAELVVLDDVFFLEVVPVFGVPVVVPLFVLASDVEFTEELSVSVDELLLLLSLLDESLSFLEESESFSCCRH